MPLTPFHLGPALLLGYLFFRYLDVPTLLLVSVAIDVRVWLVILGILPGRVHGPLHTFLGGTAFALAFAVIAYVLRPRIPTPPRWGFLPRRSSRRIVAGSLIGVSVHVLLDAPMHDDMRPFYPVEANPLLGVTSDLVLYAVCVVAGILGAVLWVRRILRGSNAYDAGR